MKPEHTRHSPPPEPQDTSELPALQNPSVSQQPGQLLGWQGSQWLRTQRSCVWQDWQGSPFFPQASVDVPWRQTPVEQQPVQAPQVDVEHWRATQLPELHAWQVAPPWPQACGELPSRHCPLEQQPAQLAAQDAPERQAPPLQFWPLGQVTQAAPPVPQAPSSAPDWQFSPTQQPAQVVAHVAGARQAPLVQASPAAQATHVPPALPQAWVEVPDRHWAPLQQPAHAPHGPRQRPAAQPLVQVAHAWPRSPQAAFP